MGAPLQGPERGGVDLCVDPSVSHIQPPAGFKPAGSFNMRAKAALPDSSKTNKLSNYRKLRGQEAVFWSAHALFACSGKALR